MNKNKGITLIALIITIIIMLILVGVSIQIVINSNLFNTAKSAGEQTEAKYEEDKTFGDNITINGKDYSNLNDYMGEIRLVGQSDGNGLKDYKIYGNSVQNGIPSPNSPVEIQSVGDKTKNLLKPTGNVIGSLLVGDGSINNLNYVTTSDFISLKAGTYTISYKTGANLRYIGLFNENKEIVGNFWSGRANPYTFTLDADYLVRIDVERDGNVQIENLETFFTEYEVQLQQGSTATEYEPYGYKIPVTATNEAGESVTTNIYLDEPLRKIGDYADYIDFENQKLVRKISEYILSGNETMLFFSNTQLNQFYFKHEGILHPVPDDLSKNVISNYYKGIKIDDRSNNFNTIYTYSEGIAMNDNNYTDVEDYVEMLKKKYSEGHPIVAYYILATQIEETIDLPTINTLEGKNTITIQTQIQPSDVILEF